MPPTGKNSTFPRASTLVSSGFLWPRALGDILAGQSQCAIYRTLESQRGFATCLSIKVSGNSANDDVGKPEGWDGVKNPFIPKCFSEGKKSIIGEEPKEA